jgi:colanic acid/amylovoran biosynthesis protein
MRFLIIGGGFSNNGAEAMLLSVSNFLKRRFPGCSILHHADVESWQEPAVRAGMTPLAPLPYVARNIRIREFVRAAIWPRFRSTRLGLTEGLYDGVVGVLDVSGFRSSDQMDGNDQRWWEIHQLKSLGVPIVFLPQAWGPFRRLGSRMYTRALLRGIPLVFARDRESLQHLHSLRVVPESALSLAADVAFQFQPSAPEVGLSILKEAGVDLSSRPLIGVAPSIVLYRQVPGEGAGNAYVQALASVCEHLVRQSGGTVVVIPHYVRQGDKPDDRFIGRSLAQTKRLGDSLRLIECDYPSADLKAVIGQLDFLIASRFHSLVAALSMRVPLAAVGWSHKYVELMGDAGMRDYVASTREVRNGDVEVVKAAWERRDDLKARLVEHVPALEESSAQALERAAQVVAAAASGS